MLVSELLLHALVDIGDVRACAREVQLHALAGQAFDVALESGEVVAGTAGGRTCRLFELGNLELKLLLCHRVLEHCVIHGTHALDGGAGEVVEPFACSVQRGGHRICVGLHRIELLVHRVDVLVGTLHGCGCRVDDLLLALDFAVERRQLRLHAVNLRGDILVRRDLSLGIRAASGANVLDVLRTLGCGVHRIERSEGRPQSSDRRSHCIDATLNVIRGGLELLSNNVHARVDVINKRGRVTLEGVHKAQEGTDTFHRLADHIEDCTQRSLDESWQLVPRGLDTSDNIVPEVDNGLEPLPHTLGHVAEVVDDPLDDVSDLVAKQQEDGDTCHDGDSNGAGHGREDSGGHATEELECSSQDKCPALAGGH